MRSRTALIGFTLSWPNQHATPGRLVMYHIVYGLLWRKAPRHQQQIKNCPAFQTAKESESNTRLWLTCCYYCQTSKAEHGWTHFVHIEKDQLSETRWLNNHCLSNSAEAWEAGPLSAGLLLSLPTPHMTKRHLNVGCLTFFPVHDTAHGPESQRVCETWGAGQPSQWLNDIIAMSFVLAVSS